MRIFRNDFCAEIGAPLDFRASAGCIGALNQKDA